MAWTGGEIALTVLAAVGTLSVIGVIAPGLADLVDPIGKKGEAEWDTRKWHERFAQGVTKGRLRGTSAEDAKYRGRQVGPGKYKWTAVEGTKWKEGGRRRRRRTKRGRRSSRRRR